MGIWNGYDEADAAIHQDEIAAERAENEAEYAKELEDERSEQTDPWAGWSSIDPEYNVRPFHADEIYRGVQCYADGTRVTFRSGSTRRGVTIGIADAVAYPFHAVRWDDGYESLVSPEVLCRTAVPARSDNPGPNS